MKRKIELLAPGGDLDSIKAAIAASADAIYCGLNRFNARNRAANIALEDLPGILKLAHKNSCKIFLTLNIVFVESEIPSLINLLNKLVNTSIDGVIVQDLGLFYILAEHFKTLKIHASTQVTTHNAGQIKFLKQLNAERINLSRELNIHEIKALTATAHQNNISTQIFVHGSYCIGFSGICYLSSVQNGNSGNRGRCSQPCRDKYLTTPAGKDFPLNLKDNSAYFDLKEIYNAGVDSLKIEGRIKKFHYVYTIVNSWKKHILHFCKQNLLSSDNRDLYKVFNRDFSNGFLKGDINKNMFIDNPRDNSAIYLSKINSYKDNSLEKAKQEVYDQKTEIINHVKNRLKKFSLAKDPLSISITGRQNTPLSISVKTPDKTFVVHSEITLAKKDKNSTAKSLDHALLSERLKTLNNTEYYPKGLQLDNLQDNLFLPFKELTLIIKKVLAKLNDVEELTPPVAPGIKKCNSVKTKPSLSVLISSPEDIHLGEKSSADLYFELPNSFINQYSELKAMFLENINLIPWFPSVLIGEHYTAAVKLLHELKPKLIVTNNTGISYEAAQKGIPWIAGPYLNLVNSYSLLCLKNKFNCSGAFISNEINRFQIKSLIRPDNFKLYYNIYHPILLLISRQCLFHQVIGCDKSSFDDECLQKCDKSSSITNLKKNKLFINKTKNNYHSAYNNHNYLNLDIITDIPDTFSEFFIDLRDVKTETKVAANKSQLIKLFENLLEGDANSSNEIMQTISPCTNAQYKKGI
jgi:putative protease